MKRNVTIKYHYPEDLRHDYLRACTQCGEMISLDLARSKQPESWKCSTCGGTNKTFWTPFDEFKRSQGLE
jgi:PHP family Zn ribbon phosphoesterase